MHNHWLSSSANFSLTVDKNKVCDKLPRDYTTRLFHLTGTGVDKGKVSVAENRTWIPGYISVDVVCYS